MSLEDRVAALEAQMAETLRWPGSATAGVRCSRGVRHGQFRAGAHGRLINGWGDQINARVDTLDNRMGSFDRRMGRLESRVTALPETSERVRSSRPPDPGQPDRIRLSSGSTFVDPAVLLESGECGRVAEHVRGLR